MPRTLQDLTRAASSSTDMLAQVIHSLLFHLVTRDGGEADAWLETFRGLAAMFPESPQYAVIAHEIEREITEHRTDRLALLREEAA